MKGTELAAAIAKHLAIAEVHLTAVKDLMREFPSDFLVVTPESITAVASARSAETVAGVPFRETGGVGSDGFGGWVTVLYRCRDDVRGGIGTKPHPAHAYGSKNGEWCDGFI